LAVENPLAKDILDAVQVLGLGVGFEPEKLHPKDWANPGRVRVSLKGADGRPLNERVKNSMIFHPLSLSLFFFFFFQISLFYLYSSAFGGSTYMNLGGG
jgi:hypothetical protein